VSNVQTIRALYDAFAQGDVPTVLAAMDPQIQWREAEGNPYQLSGKPFVGPDDVLQRLFMKLGTQWEGFTVHPKDFHDAGDTVVVEGRYTGKFSESGESLDAQMCHIFKLRDGKVTSFQQFVDTAQMQAVMGPAQR
jgi:ketosteroid isomerase-like protein